MPTRRTSVTDETISKKTKEGRGQGHGKDYQPWLTIRDVSSKGRSHRIYCKKTDRVHHLLSDLELFVHFVLAWSDKVTDIREQFPLQLKKSQEIADNAGIKHPAVRNQLHVMTTDFLVDFTDGGTEKQLALQVKYTSDLDNKRTIEKLEIERRYWESKQIPWRLVTEREINNTVKENIEWLTAKISENDYQIKSANSLDFLESEFEKNSDKKYIDICKSIDHAYHHELGATLQDVRFYIANGYMKFDIFKNFKHLKCGELTFKHQKTDQRTHHVA